MARIPQSERLPMIDRHLAHRSEVNAALPAPLVLPGTYAEAQLEAQRLECVTLTDERTLLDRIHYPQKMGSGIGPDGGGPSGHLFHLRDATGLTVVRGNRDTSLSEPE